jgi:prevent-host-death family protein
MTRVGIREARGQLGKLIDQVAAGAQVAIMKRGKEVARLIPPPATKPVPFPSHKALRASIRFKGEPISRTITRMRREKRY